MTFQILLAAAVLVAFLWLMMPDRSTSSAYAENLPADDQRRADQARQIGIVTGLMGGSVEDAAIARYAIQRAKGSAPADARDIATGTSMQLSMDDPMNGV